jgi:CubicO group peptidase (beta-lactamase class C family)
MTKKASQPRPATTLGLVLTGLLASAPLAAAAAPPEVSTAQLTLAAGYKAQFTCSATFNAGKTTAMIEAQELTNISADLQPLLKVVGPAQIDREQALVSVRYHDALPPRLAAWREHLGCASLPPGATVDDVETLPRLRFRRALPDQAELPWPAGDALPTLSERQLQLGTRLADPVTDAFAGAFGGVTSAVLIVKDGAILAERYLPGYTLDTSQRTWSVAKSLAATVIGAAVHKGILKVSDPSSIDAWDRRGDPRADITIEHLLHMNSGLDSDVRGSNTPEVYFGGGLVSQEVPRRRLIAPPGTLWQYANNDTMLVMLALRERLRSRQRYLKFPFEALLHPVGMHRTRPETDWDGNFIMSSQVWTTARDLARLGLLYLNDGVWNGKRLLPKGWAEYVRRPATTQPTPRLQAAPGTPGLGYGAQFWRLEDFEGIPADAHAAIGNRGQWILLQPSEGLLIVRRGYDYADNRFDGPGFLATVRKTLGAGSAAN